MQKKILGRGGSEVQEVIKNALNNNAEKYFKPGMYSNE